MSLSAPAQMCESTASLGIPTEATCEHQTRLLSKYGNVELCVCQGQRASRQKPNNEHKSTDTCMHKQEVHLASVGCL